MKAEVNEVCTVESPELEVLRTRGFISNDKEVDIKIYNP